MTGEELFLNELNFHIRQGISKKDLTDLINERLKQLTIHIVSQAKRTVCPDCGDYGWIYNEDATSRKVCPCHY